LKRPRGGKTYARKSVRGFPQEELLKRGQNRREETTTRGTWKEGEI